MAYLTKKEINGKTYYYAEQRVWKDGKSKRKWQKYLGSLNKIINAIEGQMPHIEHSIVFEFGGVAAYLSYAEELHLEAIINSMLPKRQQGLSIGKYLVTAAINRGVHAVSKQSMWSWFEKTILFDYWSEVKKDMLSSQRFWDNMDLIPEDKIPEIWTNIIQHSIKVKQIDLSKVCYDGTNYYTFISSFNNRSSLSQRGKNKQGRRDLRQINYALFCSQEDHIPLYFDTYEGNRHDSPEFEKIIDKFGSAFQTELPNHRNITIIFDKGNNSENNIEQLSQNNLHYLGSLKLNQVKEFQEISNKDTCLKNCTDLKVSDLKVYRKKKQVFNRELTLLLIYNPNLFDSQLKTILMEINKCYEKLTLLKQKLQDRIDGLITRGKKPTEASVKSNVKTILKRQYMTELIQVNYKIKNQMPIFDFNLSEDNLKEIKDKKIGKKILFTDNHHWETNDIIIAYNKQAVVENLFKESKNRNYGSWWPLYHYTDQKVKVHGLYCTITLLIRSLIERELRLKNIKISMERLHDELSGIKHVVNVFNKAGKSRANKIEKCNNVSKMDELQRKLFKTFNMSKYVSV